MLIVTPTKLKVTTDAGVEVVGVFQLTNVGPAPININEVRNGCFTCTYNLSKDTLSPNEVIDFPVTIFPKRNSGASMTVIYNESEIATVEWELIVNGEEETIAEPEPEIVSNSSASLRTPYPSQNLGTMKVFTSRSVNFSLTNSSPNQINIQSIRVGCGSCTKYNIPKMDIDENETIDLTVTFTPTSTGMQTKTIDVVYEKEIIRLFIVANVIEQ